jgi:hypothetical protein
VYEQVYSRPGLDLRRRELCAVAMLTTLQRLPQLGAHIESAHRSGALPSETKEVIITLLLYTGWPATLDALEVWKQRNRQPGMALRLRRAKRQRSVRGVKPAAFQRFGCVRLNLFPESSWNMASTP